MQLLFLSENIFLVYPVTQKHILKKFPEFVTSVESITQITREGFLRKKHSCGSEI